MIADLFRHVEEGCRLEELLVVVLALLRQCAFEYGDGLRPRGVSVAVDEKALALCRHLLHPRCILVWEGRRVVVHIVARCRLTDDEDHRTGRTCRECVLRIYDERCISLILMQPIRLRLLDIRCDIVVKTCDRALRDERDVHARRDDHDEDETAHARSLRARIYMTCEREIAAVGEVDKQKQEEYNERCGQNPHSRLDIVARLVPVRQIECHERGGTECVPDRHIVGDLGKRDERHEKAEYGEQCRRQTFVPEVKENAAKCGENKHTRRPDEKVIEDQRAIPVLPIRPRIEKRECQTPEQSRNHRSDHAA